MSKDEQKDVRNNQKDSDQKMKRLMIPRIRNTRMKETAAMEGCQNWRFCNLNHLSFDILILLGCIIVVIKKKRMKN